MGRNLGKAALLLFVILLFAHNVISEDVKLVTLNWEPYAGENLKDNGFTCEIIKEAFEAKGHTVTFTFMEWGAALEKAKNGDFDGVFSAYRNDERAKIYGFSEPYTISEMRFLTTVNKDIQLNGMESLKGYKIGVVKGYANTAEFDNAAYLTKVEGETEEENLLKLAKGEIDMLVTDKYTALHYISTAEKIIEYKDKFKFVDPALDLNPVYIAFSKQIPNFANLIMDFNEGLQMIRDSGKFAEIMKKHGF